MFEKELQILKRGIVDFIDEESLIKKLQKSKETKKPLVIKAGFDPTAPDLHLGHTVLLRKLRHFQDLGHQVHFLIGDFTGMVGDPTGKSKTRKQLTEEEVKANAETYKQQISKILDINKIKIVFNSEWFSKMSFKDILFLTGKQTVARLLERDDFTKRYKNGDDISLVEFMYPLMQGYDSVMLKADVELGGTDQVFNLLMGRLLQKRYGQDEQQVVMTMPLLEGLDGKEKMSKSLGNYVSLNDTPTDMLGKLMSIPDGLILKYFELLTDVSDDELKTIKTKLDSGENPRNFKMQLAKTIVAEYYSEEIATKEEELFNKKFKSKSVSLDDLKETTIVKEWTNALNFVMTILEKNNIQLSKNEIRRFLQQGSIKVNNSSIDLQSVLKSGEYIVKIGKKNIFKVKIEK